MMSLKAVSGTEAMVVSPHHLASAAGAKMLMRGGNAFDAAVAVSACLAVVYPHLAGLGGDACWITFSRGEGATRVYNASGRSGHLATREQFAGQTVIPSQGPKSALTVPGMVDGWHALLREYGTMTLAEVLEPAIGYAVNGMPVAPHLYGGLSERALVLSMHSGTARVYLPGGKVPQAGAKLVQRQLGESLQKLGADGIETFYRGELARTLTESLQAQGGLLTMEDFAAHSGEWFIPVTGSYRGYEICQAPPDSQRAAGLLPLHLLEPTEISAIPHGTYEFYHLLVEAAKGSIPDRDLRSNAPGEGSVYAAVTDKEGNAVSFMQGLSAEFGSLVTAGDTGILLHNQGSQFSLDPQHPNILEPGKRGPHVLNPAMALRDGKPALLFGTQGGDGQLQTQTSLLVRMIDYGMDPQEAINEPRWIWGRVKGEPVTELRLEKRISTEAVDKLRQSGHPVKIGKPVDGLMGHAHAVRIRENGILTGGTDPRSDGSAIGW